MVDFQLLRTSKMESLASLACGEGPPLPHKAHPGPAAPTNQCQNAWLKVFFFAS